MDLKNKINEAIENGDFEMVDKLTQELYESEFGEQNVHSPDNFAENIIASSKGEKIKMNNKFKKLAVAASCTLIIGVTGFSVNAASGGKVVDNFKTIINSNSEVEKIYNDGKGNEVKVIIPDDKNYDVDTTIDETNDNNADVNISIKDKGSQNQQTNGDSLDN